MSKVFKIFYSWQSDLPGNRTRYFIRECIDYAISIVQQADSIDALRDEATAGETGSPDIVTSIFRKIDECDLFVADLSLCFSSDTETHEGKRSPNPNVLIELGYAAQSLGWERIICFCNEEYGQINQLPFDVQHNRIHGYSLTNESRSRKDVIREQAEFIIHDVCALREQLPRSMQRGAYHVVGAFCAESASVEPNLVPMSLYERMDSAKSQLLSQTARSLFDDITHLSQQMAEEKRRAEEAKKSDEEIARNLRQLVPGISKLNEVIASLTEASISSQDQFSKPVVAEIAEQVTDWLEQLLDLKPGDGFFDFGSLRKSEISPMFGATYSGTDLEKAKYDKYIDLCRALFNLWLRTEYIKTFDEMLFFPIAIQNKSATTDQNLRVVISLLEGTPVVPDSSLIVQRIARYADQDEISGLIEELFSLPASEHIEAESVPFNSPRVSLPKVHLTPYGSIETDSESGEQYADKLTEYIMTPAGKSYYSFEVSALRPGECRWLCCGILVRPANHRVSLQYKVLSTYAGGEITGNLLYEQEA